MLGDRKNLALLIGGLALAVGGLSLAASEWLVGTWPEWIEALATAAAFLAAAVAALYAAGVFSLEEARDRRREVAEHQAQAELVAVWLARGVGTSSGPELSRQYEVQVRNASDLPIFDLRISASITMTFGGRRLPHKAAFAAQLLPPTDAPQGIARGTAVWTVPADVHALPHETRKEVLSTRRETQAITYTFRDSGGRRWARDDEGRLSQIAGSES